MFQLSNKLKELSKENQDIRDSLIRFYEILEEKLLQKNKKIEKLKLAGGWAKEKKGEF